MSLKKNKYLVIKKAISKELAIFVYNYFLMKRQVCQTLMKEKYISPFAHEWGSWNDPQAPGSYSHYADIAMETLLIKCQPIMEKHTKLKLLPTYSYARIYKKGDVLHRHKDRFSCEVSATMNLGGDKWPICLEPSGEVGMKGIEIKLNPGDMLIYRGQDLEHWREKFNGDNCAQVFLHYNEIVDNSSYNNIYDKREHPGLPCDMVKRNV
jgi:hypothetical protein|tara:strand:+ start:938 stop:1564 length:627 start_codon:yes stop_codon:yes gene_type:complete